MQSPQHRVGGKKMKVVRIKLPASFTPVCGYWALFPAFPRGDNLDQAQRSVGRAGKGSFPCWYPGHPSASVPSADIQVQTDLCFEAVCFCLQESEADCRRSIGHSSGGQDSGTEPCLFMLAKLETLDM